MKKIVRVLSKGKEWRVESSLSLSRKSIEDGSFVKMGNVATEPIKGIGRVLLTFTSGKTLCLDNVLYVPGIRKNLVSEIVLNKYCYVYLLHAKHEALDKFKIYKQEVELQRQDLIKVLHTDRGGEYYDPVYFQSIGIIHQTTAPYTPQQNGVVERKNRTLKEMVNSMLSCSGLSEGFWGEAMLTACYILNRTPNKNSKQTPYEIWTKKVSNLIYLRVWGCRAVVRLTEPKMRILGEKGIDCIFIGYAEHSKCYRFYVIESNDYVSVNSIIESRYAIFDEERFTSIPRPRGIIQPSSSKIAEDEVEGTDDVPGPSVPRKSTRTRKAKSFGSDFQLYLVEETRDKTLSQREYCFIIEEDPRTLSEAMAFRDYGLKQAPKQWHQKFDDVVLSNGFSLNQADKCVYSKFDASSKGVIICLYVDDMLIFGTDQDQVNKTKEFLSSNFDMKDLGEAEVILGIRIKRENNGISISQSHYIENILTKFNFANCSPVDPTVKFRPNKGTLVSQLEYSRAIGCLMYAMISTRPDIAFAVGKLSSGYPSVIEGYSDASWINNMEDHSSTSGWVFLLGGGAISWASKKQTCITSSTMESEFVALAAAGNEAEWLRNLVNHGV
ncbi:zinc finger, CCHC-type containing protein [Tanacetum coccineum]